MRVFSLHKLSFVVAVVLASMMLWLASAVAKPVFMPDGDSGSQNFSNYSNSQSSPEESTSTAGDIRTLSFYEGYRSQNAAGETNNNAMEGLCADGYFIQMVVSCVTKIIDEAVILMLEEYNLLLNGYILALIVLAVTIFGARILTGMVEKPGPESFGLLLKIAGVLLFTNAMVEFVPYIFDAMEEFAGYTASYLSGAENGFAVGCGADLDVTVWQRIDCLVGGMFGGNFSAMAANGQPGHQGVLPALMSSIVFVGLLGFAVFLLIIAILVPLLLLLLRCVFVYLSAYAFLALLMVISPLIIPLILFKNTAAYFDKWLKQVIAQIVQPAIVIGYLAFVFAVIDSMLFKDEQYSLAAIIGVGWQNTEPQYIYESDAELDEMMAQYSAVTGDISGDENYDWYREYLKNKKEFKKIGNIPIEEQYLITIEFTGISDLTAGVEGVPVIGEVMGDLAGAADHVISNALEKVTDTLIPFKVMRINPETGSAEDVLGLMLNFCVTMIIFVYLLNRFADTIPWLVQMMTEARQGIQMGLPGEKQAYGVAGASVGLVKGAVSGAVQGALKGGKKGAIVGAVAGGVQGTDKGYQKGVQTFQRKNGG